MSTYYIDWTDGSFDERTFTTTQAAIQALEEEYPECVTLEVQDPEGAKEVLVWASEEEAQDDPGFHAIAGILRK